MSLLQISNTLLKSKRIEMLIGLDDFDIDMFLTFEDDNIFIYYSDFETIPELAELIPLGSFDNEEKFRFKNLNFDKRIEVGLLFLLRDKYLIKDPDSKKLSVNIEIFLREFEILPEVTNFIQKYTDRCKYFDKRDKDNVPIYPCPKEWLGWHDDWCTLNIYGDRVIDWNTYPHNCIPCNYYTDNQILPPIWCQPCELTTTAPTKCMEQIPLDIMPPDDIYFLIIVYFNGIYRVKPQYVQNFGLYQILTDIDFELNNYTMIVDIQEFFTREFQYFLKTLPGDLPFAADFGTGIKKAIQTKNTEIRRIEIQNELEYFIVNFNDIWGNLVAVENIYINSSPSDGGAVRWLIDVQAKIKQERLIYRIEI